MSDFNDNNKRNLYLSNDEVTFFHKNGYIVLPSFWESSDIELIRGRAISLVDNADLSSITSVFSTKENMRKADDYFLTSGREIRFFWEEKAWKSENGELDPNIKPHLAINKMGHGLHDLDEIFEKYSYEGRIGSICKDLGLTKPLLAQSMYIFKQARIGAFLYTEPQSCIGFWWPLDDCTVSNGCLYAVPGSHHEPVSRRFHRRDSPNEGTEFLPLEPCNWEKQLEKAVPLETKKGSLVVLHNALIHYSNENLSDEARHAYSIHVVDGSEGIVYPADNWLQRPPEFPFREITNTITR